jgi:hypothetical protein
MTTLMVATPVTMELQMLRESLEVDESVLEFETLGIINNTDEVCKTQNSKPQSLLSLGHHPLCESASLLMCTLSTGEP